MSKSPARSSIIKIQNSRRKPQDSKFQIHESRLGRALARSYGRDIQRSPGTAGSRQNGWQRGWEEENTSFTKMTSEA